jgi:hemerythrin
MPIGAEGMNHAHGDACLDLVVLDHRLLTCVSSMDDEHGELIGLYNDFVLACRDEGGGPRVKGRLREFYLYTNYHCATEEQLMRTTAYPGYRDHLMQHRVALEEIEAVMEGVGQSDGLAAPLARAVGHRLVAHVQGPDQDLGRFRAIGRA